jgi:hypothetical protein
LVFLFAIIFMQRTFLEPSTSLLALFSMDITAENHQ